MINITHHTIVIKKSSIVKVFLGNGDEGIDALKKIIGYNDEMYPTLFSEDDMLISFSSEMVRRNHISQISEKDLETMGLKKDIDFTIAKQFPPSCKVNWLTLHSNLNGTFAELKLPGTRNLFAEIDMVNHGIENIEKVLSELYLMRRGKSDYRDEMKIYCSNCGREKVSMDSSACCPSCSKPKTTDKVKQA